MFNAKTENLRQRTGAATVVRWDALEEDAESSDQPENPRVLKCSHRSSIMAENLISIQKVGL